MVGSGPLRDGKFRLFWIGETTSTAGSAMAVVAMPLTAVLVLHASTLTVGLLQATAWLPALLIGIPVGAWVDRRRSKRVVMITADLVAFALFLSVPIAAWTGVLTMAQLVVVAFLAGATQLFFRSCFGRFMRSFVPAEHRAAANATMEGGIWASQLAGPSLAGLAAQLLGAVSGLLANALSFLVSAACLTRIKGTEPPPAPREKTALRTDMAEGIRFVARDPYLRVIIGYMGVGNFAECLMDAVMVVFLVRTVGLGAGLAGVLVATLGVGGILGALIATRVGVRLGTARGLLVVTIFGSACMLLLPLTSRGVGMSLFAVGAIVYGTGICVSNIIAQTFSQNYVPADMQGRESGVVSFVVRGTQPFGAVAGAVIGESFGPRTAMWVATAAIAASAAIQLIGPLRKHPDLPAHHPSAELATV
jgi:MFS family permease